jgi:predicted GNAT family acetyltransferase
MRITPPQAVPGALYEAAADDTEQVIAWYEAFRSEITVLTQDPRSFVPQQIAARRIFFWKDRGRPVSMSAWTGPTAHGVRIGMVYTPPEHRNRGYASASVAELAHRLLTSGRTFITLNADLANPAPNSIYQKIGFQLIDEIQEYEFTVP